MVRLFLCALNLSTRFILTFRSIFRPVEEVKPQKTSLKPSINIYSIAATAQLHKVKATVCKMH